MQNEENAKRWKDDENYRRQVVRDFEEKFGRISREEFALLVF